MTIWFRPFLTSTSEVHRVVDNLGSVGGADDLVVVLQLLDEKVPVEIVVVDSVVARLLQVEDDPLVLRGKGRDSDAVL